jgi:hypothetical protein
LEVVPGSLRVVPLAVIEAALFAGPAQNREAFIDAIRTLGPYGKVKKELFRKAFAPAGARAPQKDYREELIQGKALKL